MGNIVVVSGLRARRRDGACAPGGATAVA